MKQLNLQSIRDAIDLINKNLQRYATLDDLKRTELQINNVNTKTEKNTSEIKTLQELISQIQKSNGHKSLSSNNGPSVDLAPINTRVSFLINSNSCYLA